MKKISTLVLLLLCASTYAQLLDKNFWHVFGTVLPGEVFCSLIDSTNKKLYVGGKFDYTGPHTPNLAKVDASGNPDLTLLKPDGEVNCMIPDGSGGWYIGGEFFNIGGVARKHLAQINSAGSLTSFDPVVQFGSVNSMRLRGNTLYIAGGFTNVGGQIRNRLASVNATTGAVTAWDPDVSSTVTDIDVDAATGVVYAVGVFTTIGGVGRQYIGAVDSATGVVTAFNPTVSGGFMECIRAYGNAVYIGGYFTTVNGNTRNRLASLDKATGSLNSFNPNPNSGSITQIEFDNGLLYASGGFTNIGGVTRNCIAAMNPVTGVPTSWNPYMNDYIKHMAITGSVVYIVGDFTIAGGQSRQNIAALNLATNTATSWTTTANERPNMIAANGTDVFVGGTFVSVGGTARTNLACFDLVTGKTTSWNPNVTGIISQIQKSGDTIFLAGVSTVNGTNRPGYASVLATNANLLAWNPNAQNSSFGYSMSVYGPTVYVGGYFYSIGGIGLGTNPYLGAVNRTNGTGISWFPKPKNSIAGLTAYNGKLYVYGGFDSTSNDARARFAVYNVPSNTLNAWNPGNISAGISRIRFNNGTGYLVGSIDTFAGQPRKNLVSFDPVANTLNAWAPVTNSTVSDIGFRGNQVYIGGYFTTANGVARNYFAELDGTTGALQPWQPEPNNLVNTIECAYNQLVLGGRFNKISGEDRFGFAVYRFLTLAAGNLPVNGYCQGGTISLPVSSTGIFSGNNVFTLQVSDASGSFAAPVNIGTLASSGGGTITGTLPGNLPLGGAYKVRIISSSPAIVGNESAQSFQISLQQVPSLDIATDTAVICSGAPVRFAATPVNGGTAPTYQWKINGVSVSGNSDTLVTSTLATGSKVWCVLTSNAACAIPATVNSDTITITVISIVPPQVQLAASADSICSGTSVTYTATPANAFSPTYAWYVNGSVAQSGSTATYSSASLQHNDSVWVVLTSNSSCSAGNKDTSNLARISVVTPPVVPSVTIAPGNNGDTICSGTSVTFTAVSLNGGSNPTLQWIKNGQNVGTNAASYTPSGLSTNDSVWVILTSSALCATGVKDTSNKRIFTVAPVLNPTVSIAATQTTVCAGTAVTFTATDAATGGNTGIHQWKKNGNNVGSNATTYTDSTLANGDVITCQLSGILCAATATSNTITVVVTTPLTPNITIATTGSVSCAGQSVTFTSTVTGTGSTPQYLWLKNNANTGSAGTSYTTSTLAQGDVIKCVITTNQSCVTKSTDTSNTITVTVNNSVTPAITIAASKTGICAGESVTFTATPVNGGTSPSLLWIKNGNSVGFSGNPYTTSNLANNDVITVRLNSNAQCAAPAQVFSAGVTMAVTTPVTPTISQSGNMLSSSAASGNQWYLNGNPINGANGQSYTPVADGSYTVVVVQNGCSGSVSNTIDFVINSIAQLSGETITVYPNPAATQLYISSTRAIENVRMYDVSGKEVYNATNLWQNTIDVSHFAAGSYIAKIQTQAGIAHVRWIKL